LSEIALAAGIMLGVGLTFGIMLAVANAKLRVEEDPRIDDIEGMLPGSNCGACGQPGCRGFAENVVLGKVAPSSCTVSSPDGVAAIAAYLGVDAGSRQKRVARLHCAGGKSSTRHLADYRACRRAARHSWSMAGAGLRWGCLSLAD
jgi:RnfABCDGE-type electron transport complex B subunit